MHAEADEVTAQPPRVGAGVQDAKGILERTIAMG